MKLIYNINSKKYLLTYATTKLPKKISSGYSCNANDIRFQNIFYRLIFCSIWNFYQIPKEWVPQAQKIPKMTLKCPTLIFGLFFPICFITVLCSFIVEVIWILMFFLIDFVISLAAMSLEYSLAKAREKQLLKRVLDLQRVIILRSRF